MEFVQRTMIEQIQKNTEEGIFRKIDNNKDGYYMICYNKDELKKNDPTYSSNLSKCRSMIFNKHNDCVCFSPMKSMTLDSFENMYQFGHSNVVVEEFVEGTMINLFYDKENKSGPIMGWDIATKTKVGGYNSFYSYGTPVNKNFKQMFYETVEQTGLNIEKLNKNYCYSFVMQHMENRIVSDYQFNNLILVEAYEITNEDSSLNEESNHSVYIKHFDVYTLQEMFNDTSVRLPERFNLTKYDSYKNIFEHFSSKHDDISYKRTIMNTPIDVVIKGIVIKNIITGERTKSRNDTYEFLAKLRGNQSKLEYHYLTLRKEKNMELFLHVYPEFENDFLKFRDKVHNFTQALFYNYYRCFKQHSVKLNELPYELRSHLYEIHGDYIKNIRGTGKTVQFENIKNYVNELPEARLMYSLNYNMRPQENVGHKLVRQYASGVEGLEIC